MLPNLPQDGGGEGIQVLRVTPGQVVNLPGAAAVSAAALNPETRVIRVLATGNVNFRADGTATTTDTLLVAGIPEYFAVNRGDAPSFIDPLGVGSIDIYLTEMQ